MTKTPIRGVRVDNEPTSTVDAIVGLGVLATFLVVGVIWLVGSWKAFGKAGREGIEALIPIWNLYVCCRIGGVSGWWFLGCFIPLFNLVAFAVIFVGVAKNFGKSALFGIGLWILGFIFWPILGFGDAEYVGPSIRV